MKSLSLQYKLIAVFMALQFVVLWVVQLEQFTYNRYLIHATFLMLSALAMVIIGLIRIAEKKVSIKRPTLVQILIFILAVQCIIATVFGLDSAVSLVGREDRFEGLYSIFCYYMLCIWATTVSDFRERKLLVYEFLVIGLISAVVGILSGVGVVFAPNTHWKGVATIPFGNPNFYGSMMALTAAVALGMMLYSATLKENVIGAIALLITFLATFSCDSSSPLVGNIMMFLIVIFAEIVVYIRSKNKKRFETVIVKLLIGVALWFAAAFLTNAIRHGSVTNEISRNAYYMDEGITSDKMFSNRMGVWKFTLKQIPRYWLHGVGPDNFWLLSGSADASLGINSFDRVHNEYLQLAICQGIPALVTYLIFLFAIFINGLKKWFRNEENEPIYLLPYIAFFAYIAQAFFNISVIQVAPFFWIMCGLCVADNKKELS